MPLGGKTFNLQPIEPRQMQGIPATSMAQNGFDPILDLETGLQNVEGLTQGYYDLWAGLNSTLKEQQALGIDPFDPTNPEGQQLGRTIMKTIGAMRMIGDQLKTGQQIQQAMLPYIATGQTRLAGGEDLSENVTSVQDIQNKFVPQRVDPTVQEANRNYARSVERGEDLNMFNQRLGQEQADWNVKANDPDASPADREYAQRQVAAVGRAFQNIPQFNPWTYQRQTGFMTPETIAGIKQQWWNIVSGKDLGQLYESNKNIIKETALVNPNTGILSYDEFKNGKRIRRYIDISKANNYGLSSVNNALQQGLPSSDQIPIRQMIQNGIDPSKVIFTDTQGNRIEPFDEALVDASQKFVTDVVNETTSNRLTSSNPYAKQLEGASGQVATPPGYESTFSVPTGSMIDKINSSRWGKTIDITVGGETISLPTSDIKTKEFLQDLFNYNYDYFGFPKTQEEFFGEGVVDTAAPNKTNTEQPDTADNL